MKTSETISLLRAKIARILGLLLLVRLCLYIPVPNVDLDIFSQGQVLNPLFGFAKTLTGSSFLGLGSLGILPYINASIMPMFSSFIINCTFDSVVFNHHLYIA